MALPSGWEAKQSGGRVVFINHFEKKTQYEGNWQLAMRQ
jgi:hypothetical protein